MSEPAIPLTEYAERRSRLLEALDGAAGLVLAGRGGGSLHDSYRPHVHFEYLTGLIDEPGAMLLLDPGATDPKRSVCLFLEPRDPEMERWDGHRPPLDGALRERLGIESVFRTPGLSRFLLQGVRRLRKVACLHPLASHDQPVSPDLEILRKVAERVPGTSIHDASDVIPRMRSVKSANEIACIERAVAITAKGFEAALATLLPGVNEFEIEEAIHHGYRTNGSRGPAFGTIVGAGRNGTVLHYRSNSAPIADGDLVVVDSGARYGAGEGGYGGDITRAFPANGRFSDRQREIYELVLAAQTAAIAAARPGVTFEELDEAARSIIREAGHADAYIHGIGHHLGLETHDATPLGALEENCVVTIEPGVYLPDEAIGVRIEDDVLVTPQGGRVLGPPIPKTVEEIESILGGR